MTYNITKTNGKTLTELENGVVDPNTLSGIDLIGYLTPNYGCEQSNNFVHLTENFANYNFPKNPINGMICYIYNNDSSSSNSGIDGELYLCVNGNSDDNKIRWRKLPNVIVLENTPTKELSTGAFRTGDMWYNSESHSFNMYDENLDDHWVKIGPNDYETSEIKVVTSDNSGIMDLMEFSLNGTNGKYDKMHSYFLNIYVVGKEIGKNTSYLNKCATGAWKIQLLINAFQNDYNNGIVEMIGLPDYELIGASDNTWNVNVELENNKLILKTVGTGYDSENTVKWVAKLEILKVK